jgi:two-component sensor histidine kinase
MFLTDPSFIIEPASMKTSDIWKNVSADRKSDFLSDGGRMGRAILAFDWSGTSIGPIDRWPQSLRSAVQMAVLTRQAICIFWGSDLNMIYNDAYAPFLGAKEEGALGKPAEEVWSDVWTEIAPIIQEALSGRGTWGENMPLMMTRNGYEEQTYWSFSYSPLYADDGTIGGMINITTETTATVLAKAELEKNVDEVKQQIELEQRRSAQQKIVQREMAHRIKNILAMSMAVVSQTLRHSTSLDYATETITKRITALSSAQDVLTDAGIEEADLRTLVDQVLAPHIPSADRIILDGPAVVIPNQAALGMALALHELATNAAKYGAWSADGGIVHLTWSFGNGGEFRIQWKESGGPPVIAPERKGFGSRLTNRIVPGYMAGKAESHYEPSGFRYVLSGTIGDEETKTRSHR